MVTAPTTLEPLAEQTITRAGGSVHVSVEFGDALQADGDVLLLKYAQATYGLDRVVIDLLGPADPALLRRLPLPGATLVAPAVPALRVRQIVIVGTPPLDRFGYDALRTWARDGWSVASQAMQMSSTTGGGVLVTTVQGVRTSSTASLEPGRALLTMIEGVFDALATATTLDGLETLRIVEHDRERAQLLADALLAAVNDPEDSPGSPDALPDELLSGTVRSSRDELRTGQPVTAAMLAAAIQRRHPEYAGGALAGVAFDPDGGTRAGVDDWLHRVRRLYPVDPVDVTDWRLTGRPVLAGLAMLDHGVRGALERAEALEPLLAELKLRPRDPFLRHQVSWSPDTPVGADGDRLGRALVARSIAGHLEEFDRDHRGHSFVTLIDGRWGAGKSTLLAFLIAELNRTRTPYRRSPKLRRNERRRNKQPQDARPQVCVVTFDAWRQSRAGPAWLRLMSALRRQLIADGRIGWWGRLRERSRRMSSATVIGTALLVVTSSALAALWISGVWSFDSVAARVPTIITFATTLITTAATIGTLLAADSERRARSFVVSSAEPMERLSEHFTWLRCRCGGPLLLVIDDLDRCEPAYVVELLDAVQKLVRGEGAPGPGQPTLFVVVAADGRWLRAAYELSHQAVADAIGEPGRPLGSLFLDKLFQVRIPVPELSPRLQQQFLERLLGVGVGRTVTEDQRGAATERIEAAGTHQEVLEVLRSVPALERIKLAEQALLKLNAADQSSRSEAHHALERFAPLLEPNPRSVLRFLIAFSALPRRPDRRGQPGVDRVAGAVDDRHRPLAVARRAAQRRSGRGRVVPRRPGGTRRAGTAERAADDRCADRRTPSGVQPSQRWPAARRRDPSMRRPRLSGLRSTGQQTIVGGRSRR